MVKAFRTQQSLESSKPAHCLKKPTSIQGLIRLMDEINIHNKSRRTKRSRLNSCLCLTPLKAIYAERDPRCHL